MLTIFTIPKSFEGHIGIIQHNALQSWKRLEPECEIILCGDAPGVRQAALEYSAKHIPDISLNEFGTPFLNSAFEKAIKAAHNRLICYVNADIILLNHLVLAIRRIPFDRFLAVGRRTNVDISKPWDFENPHWRNNLIEFAKKNGRLEEACAIDYLVFPSDGDQEEIPPFIVGRPLWDNWFIFNTRRNKIPIIDITPVSPAVHQNHDYSHIPENLSNTSWEGPETDYNTELYIDLIGAPWYASNIMDATHILTKSFLLPAIGPGYLFQHLYTATVLNPSLRPFEHSLRLIQFIPKWIRDGLMKK